MTGNHIDFDREVGNIRASRSRFNHSLALNPYHVLTLQLRSDMLYHSGEPYEAMQDFKVRFLIVIILVNTPFTVIG